MNSIKTSAKVTFVLLGLLFVFLSHEQARALAAPVSNSNEPQQTGPSSAEDLSSDESNTELSAAETETDFLDLVDGPSANAAEESEPDEDEVPSAAVSNNLRWSDQADAGDEPRGSDSNIENARVQASPDDMATAAGHHHHHHHYVHGKLDMGAHTGKKGSFGWHDKHPVGGKGRR